MFILWKDILFVCTERSRLGGFYYCPYHYEEFRIYLLSSILPFTKHTSNAVCIYIDVLHTILIFYLDVGLLARSRYPEGPATGHLSTGFAWFPCV
jgi:hypothetical protein